jgi:hypothetical protein
MEKLEALQETVQPNSKPDARGPDEDGADPAPRKPGSKAQGRKRTKTGCLSKPTITSSSLTLRERCN